MKKVDRRIAKTQTAVEEALLSLLKRKKYSEITIMDIVNEANISKATLYLHYKNKDDIAKILVQSFFEEYDTWLQKNKPVTLNQSFLMIFEILYTKKEKFLVIVNAELDHLIMDTSRLFSKGTLEESIIIDSSIKYRPYLNDFLSGGFYLVIFRWFKNGMKENPAKMAEICSQFFTIL